MSAAALLLLAAHVLTLDEAVKTAEANLPALKQARAQTDVFRARADSGLSTLLPQLSTNATYMRRTANTAPQPGVVPAAVTDASQAVRGQNFDTLNFFNFALNANQLIWDFQSVDRYRAAVSTARAQETSQETTLLQALLVVRTAFFTARAQKALVEVARETLANMERHLQQVQGFVEIGTRPEIDLAQARADRANARLQLINAENGYANARAQLNQAMGVERGTDYDVADDTLGAVDGEDDAVEGMVDEALRARPEFKAFDEQLRAQELVISATQGGYWPGLSTGMGFTAAGTDVQNLAWNWNLSVSLGWRFFEGGLTRAQVREGRANLAVIRAQRDGLRLQARVEVEQARLNVRAAREGLAAAQEVLTNARERLRLAEGRYQTGVGNVIELFDAQMQDTLAAGQAVQAEYNVSTARAQLLRALGRR